MRNPKEKYEKRKGRYSKLIEKQTRTINLLSNLRLLVFAAGAAASGYFYITRNYYLFAAIFIAFVVSFIWMVIEHRKAINNKQYLCALYDINDKSLKRLNGEWISFPDSGKDFMNINHNYSGDLDIFGEGSLFQWINTACTWMGRQKLKNELEQPQKSRDAILEKQAAARELAVKLKWRQRFMAEGMIGADKIHDPEFLFKWADENNEFYCKPWVIVVFRLIPVVTILLVLMAFIVPGMPFYIPVLALFAQYVMLKMKGKERAKILSIVEKYKNNIRIYENMIKSVEKLSVKSEYLKQLKNNLVNEDKHIASRQIKNLAKIVDSITNRYNAFYMVFNIITLWDYQCRISLECWKKKSGKYLRQWLDTIGQMEALSSIAIIGHDNPEWIMPEITVKSLAFDAEQMGHPLLGENRVCNDLKFDSPTKILLVTGSNMSGKSTLLRTAGINLVLAYAGAPVCAKKFTCSIMEIYTCMRIGDNLEKSISSFYAELLRIKSIINALKKGKPIFFLLDEIFKGTNSWDRHTGAKILIKKLYEEEAMGLVSTHDLELAEIENETHKKVQNFHFREYYNNNEIHFDYKLRSGVSTTRNAIYLMKMAGIEFNE